VSNYFELINMLVMEAPSGILNSTAFPVIVPEWHWTSTTNPENTVNALQIAIGANGISRQIEKTIASPVLLVRGG
jgi:hypothetical protein